MSEDEGSNKLSHEEDKEEFELVRLLKSVNCKILEEGYKKVDMKYFFCKCDPDQKDPICPECAEHCHKGEGHEIAGGQEGKQICHCGERNHVLETKKRKADKLYNPKCTFHEWSSVSGINVYYETDTGKKICMYCRNFCKYEAGLLTKKKEKKVPICECDSHVNIKDIFVNINKIASNFENYEFEYLTLVHFTNLMFSCKKSFDNVFKQYDNYMAKFREDVQKEDFSFDPNIGFSVFSWANMNLMFLGNHIEKYYYFSEVLRKNYSWDYVSCCLEAKAENNSSWVIKSNIFANFRTLVFLNDFNFCPFLKINDIQNFNPLMRLVIASNVKDNSQIMTKYVNNLDANFLNKVLDLIEKINGAKDKSSEDPFDILKRLFSLCKIFGKYNLFTTEQIIRFCDVNDQVIHKFSEMRKFLSKKDSEEMLNLIRSEVKILVPLMKGLTFLIYYYNDQIVESYLQGERDEDSLNFFHTNSEVAQLLIRNTINVANFIRLYYETLIKRCEELEKKEELDQKDKEELGLLFEARINMKKILALSVNLTTMCTVNPDNYLLGFRRLLDKDTATYLRYLKGNFHDDEKEFLDLVRVKTEDLETAYQQYFELKVTEKELKKIVLENVKALVESIGETIQIPKDLYDKQLFADVKVKKSLDQLSSSTRQSKTKTIIIHPKVTTVAEGSIHKTVLVKSYYVFSLVKAIKIISLSRQATDKHNYLKNNQNIDDELFDKIYDFLYFFIEKDCENCMILLTNEIVSLYQALNIKQGEKFIDLYFYALSLIKAKEAQLSSFKSIRRLLKWIFKDLENNPKLAHVLDKGLKLLKVFVELTVANEDHMFIAIRKILKNVYKGNLVFISIKELLMRKITLDDGEQLNWHRVSTDVEILEDEITVVEEEKKTTVKGKKRSKGNKSGKSPNDLKTLKDYNINLILKAYVRYLNLVNYAFDGTASDDETAFLSQILTSQEIIEILKNKEDLDLSLRIEMLKFYRMTYIDLSLEKDKLIDYYSAFINPVNADGEGIYIDDIEYYKFLNDIIKIKNGSDKIEDEYRLLKFELLNFRDIITKDERSKDILDYLESGIIMPLNIFFNKFMSLIFNHNGYDFVKFYEIVYYFLEFKKYLIENKHIFQGKAMKKRKGFFGRGIQIAKKKVIIVNEEFLSSNIEDIQNDINELTSDSFEVLNYKNVYGFLEKHFKNFLIKDKAKSLKDFFTKKKLLYNEEKIQKLQKRMKDFGLQCNELENKVLNMLVFYENEKLNFGQSSFIKNMDEVNILYDTKNRNLLMLFLLFLHNHHLLSDRYKRFNFFTILKILQYDTVYVQQEIYKIFSKNPSTIALHGLVNEFMFRLNSLVLSTCNPGNSQVNEDYIISINILKVLKYLCEEHNRHFQKIFMRKLTFNYDVKETGVAISSYLPSIITLFNLMLVIVNKIILLSKWEKVRFDADEQSISFFYDMFFAIIEFLIEMVQGTEGENMLILLIKTKEEEATQFQSFLNISKGIVLKDKNDSCVLYNVRNDLVNFLMAFLEEKETPEKVIRLISIAYNPYNMCDSIVNTMKKIYLKNTGGDVKTYKNISFERVMFKFFEDKYFNDPDFPESQEFSLAKRMYQYVRLMADEYKDEDAISILTQSNQSIHTQYTDMCRFFDLITKTVYVYKDKINFRVLFAINPKTAYLSANTKVDFLEHVNRETRYTKLFGLIENSEYFLDEINHNHKESNKFTKLLNDFKYRYYEVFSFILVLIANFIFLYYLERDSKTNVEKTNIAAMIVEIFIIALNALVIICWFYTKYDLYCTIEQKKYALREKTDMKKLSTIRRFWINLFHAFILKNEVTTIFINMILAILGTKWEFLYCFQLFTLINLSVTLKNIVRTITLRYDQIFSIILLIAVCVYLFAFGGYNFINSHEEWKNGLHENQCETLFYCFLTNLDLGIRTDGGIGEYLPRYTFQIIGKRYMKIFIFTDLYFIAICVVLIIVLLGVIIDTFVELREKTDKQNYSKESICFICGATRDELEKDNINYENHVSTDHNVWNYAFYIIGLRYEDPQELNAINSYAYEAIEKKAISWIPPYDGLTLKVEEGSDNEEESE